MPAVAFPDLRPSARTYSPGKYPQQEFVALNGAVTRLLYGTKRSDAELSLDFNALTDSEVVQILTNYENVTRDNDWVTFTAANAAVGASTNLANYIQENRPDGLRWRYADPPEVVALSPNRSNVRCRFIGQLDAA